MGGDVVSGSNSVSGKSIGNVGGMLEPNRCPLAGWGE